MARPGEKESSVTGRAAFLHDTVQCLLHLVQKLLRWLTFAAFAVSEMSRRNAADDASQHPLADARPLSAADELFHGCHVDTVAYVAPMSTSNLRISEKRFPGLSGQRERRGRAAGLRLGRVWSCQYHRQMSRRT